ncbi:ThuA domain-containing protein [Luteolibacter yonseiensis]|uniref:ThuA domain-containing protein n=1 Tax=Luteolibacter yonseiensis TaxID=1144680 RepID=A0A934R8E3_9BACT|nr:ThuA domain-containing protein [Luteolibacter yonseiensis]MBK1818207.1 ThuA domain-containing protein [Luteolibacter yonseiensis]
MFRTFLTLAIATALPASAGKIGVLLITGQNNHDWVSSTPVIERLLEETGRFDVTVSTTPSPESPKDAWNDWNPAFKNYDVVLSDYNGEIWPDTVKTNFTAYVNDGGRVTLVHAANNAFGGWKEFETMTGLLWRDSNSGDRVYLDENEKPVRQPKGEGPGAGHGAGHAYQITTRDSQNPIFKDLPKVWMHVADELYHGQRGPAENMRILATAFSSKESGGTGVHEPMIWWIPYGKGRVITLVPGHMGKDQSKPTP